MLIKGEMEGDIEDEGWAGQRKAVKLGFTQRLFGVYAPKDIAVQQRGLYGR